MRREIAVLKPSQKLTILPQCISQLINYLPTLVVLVVIIIVINIKEVPDILRQGDLAILVLVHVF